MGLEGVGNTDQAGGTGSDCILFTSSGSRKLPGNCSGAVAAEAGACGSRARQRSAWPSGRGGGPAGRVHQGVYCEELISAENFMRK